MPTPTKGARLGGSAAHQKLMLANLATSLFEHGRITTTEAKAKRLRPYAERLITFAKRGDLHARRIVMQSIRDKDVVHHLFAEIGPRYEERPGGYTRILKVGPRKGDNAPMALIELVEEVTARQSVTREAERARAAKKAPAKKAAAKKSAEKATGAAKATAATVDVDVADTETETAESSTASKSTPSARRSRRSAAAAEPAEVDTDDLDADTVEAVDETEAPAGSDSAAEVEVTPEAPYGPGSHAPLPDDAEPDGFPVKGNADSMLYHLPGTPAYARTIAEVWFDTPESAEAAGFELPPSQRHDDEDDDGLTILDEDK